MMNFSTPIDWLCFKASSVGNLMYGMGLPLAGRPEFVDEIRNSFNLFS